MYWLVGVIGAVAGVGDIVAVAGPPTVVNFVSIFCLELGGFIVHWSRGPPLDTSLFGAGLDVAQEVSRVAGGRHHRAGGIGRDYVRITVRLASANLPSRLPGPGLPSALRLTCHRNAIVIRNTMECAWVAGTRILRVVVVRC